MANEKILIVEDEYVTSTALKATLEEAGYVVAGSALSEAEAVRLAGELKPDLVLMDIVLQDGSDGIRAAQVIKDEYNIPVVYITAHASPDTVMRASITEPFGYIIKPFNEKELRGNIEIALYKFEMESNLSRQLDEVERINKLMVGRELLMEELKKENERLKEVIELLEK